MARYVSFLNPSRVDQEGLLKYLNRLFGPGVATAFNANGWKVSQRGAGANMSVDVAVGDGLLNLPTNAYGFWGWTDATENVVVTAANPTNPRIDVVVAWVDTTVTSTGSSNSPSALKFQIMAGTPAGSPVVMNDATIQSTLGSGVAWIKLATIAVAAGSTSVVTANITDQRTGITSLPQVADGSISAAKYADNSVTAPKLAASAITLDYQQITSSVVSSTTGTIATGLSRTVVIPSSTRRVRITAEGERVRGSISGALYGISIWDGTAGSGTLLKACYASAPGADKSVPARATAIVGPFTAGTSKTWSVGLYEDGGSCSLDASATSPVFIHVEHI
ncbi:hypothetical protein [Rhodococcus sp. NPDC004095]